MPRGHVWRVNALIGTAHFLSHFYVLCLPPLFLAWKTAFDVSYSQLGLTVALMSATTAILQTPVGFLVDRYGARYFLISGTLLMSLSITAMGYATDYWQIVLCSILSGVGNSVIHPSDYAILSGSIPKERMGKAFAFHTFNGNVGFALAPPVMALLMTGFGWRSAAITVGLLGVPTVAAIILQSRILVDQAKPPPQPANEILSGRQLLTSRVMLGFFAFFMFSAMAGAGIQSWLITVLHAVHGIDIAVASSALTGYMVGGTAGVLVGGYFVDRPNIRLLPFIAVLAFSAASLLVLADLLRMPDFFLIATLFTAGICMGASRTPRDMMVRDAAPAGQIGKVFGFVSAGLPFGQALTPVPFGFLIDHGRPEWVLLLAAGLVVISVFCAGAARSVAAQQAAAPAAAQ
ncbi:MAG: MFS transporter [Acetobacteraceae bacterium]|nr:MFS transporter [Acetobacteraceae bacterium]